MPDCFYESDTENTPESDCECLDKDLYQILRADCIRFMRSPVNKILIGREKESDT